jgi:ABC-type uncharacterized transport system auxiliary subunit
MTRNFLVYGAICLACLLTSGCAFTRTETQVNFSPVVLDPIGPQRKAALTVGDFTDSRLVEDKYVLLQKANGYGQTTSGAFVTKEPVADILKQGLTEALRKNGFATNTTAQYELRGDLKSFGGGVIQGFWSSTTKAEITVRFELIKSDSGQPVWHDTFSGQTTKKYVLVGADFYAELFTDAGTDLVRKLIEDKTFRSFFQ